DLRVARCATERQFIGDSVTKRCAPGNADASVAARMNATCPRPTLALSASVHPTPEALREWDRAVFAVLARLRSHGKLLIQRRTTLPICVRIDPARPFSSLHC